MNTKHVRVEAEIAGLPLILETGQVARQAHGAVIATLGGTMTFAAIAIGPAKEEQDFFPLTVDYREKTEAAGKIPGGFFKREGRPTTKEILTMRLIDRSIRPMFPEGFKNEVQVMCHPLMYDGTTNADVTAMIAAFAAVRISGVPFEATLGAVRIGHLAPVRSPGARRGVDRPVAVGGDVDDEGRTDDSAMGERPARSEHQHRDSEGQQDREPEQDAARPQQGPARSRVGCAGHPERLGADRVWGLGPARGPSVPRVSLRRRRG